MMLKRTSTPCAASLPLIKSGPRRVVQSLRNGQIKIHRIAWENTFGPTVARHLSETLYANETYVISFDSITNFARGWGRHCDRHEGGSIIRAIAHVGSPQVTVRRSTRSAGRFWMRRGPVKNVGRLMTKLNRACPVISRQMSICRTRRVAVGRTTSFKHDVPADAAATLRQHWAFLWRRASILRPLPRILRWCAPTQHSARLFDFARGRARLTFARLRLFMQYMAAAGRRVFSRAIVRTSTSRTGRIAAGLLDPGLGAKSACSSGPCSASIICWGCTTLLDS